MVYHASPDEKYQTTFVHSINYLLDSQYPNSGFPQFYPLRGDNYFPHITFNDGDMVRPLEMLNDVAMGLSPYDLVDAKLRAKATTLVQCGIDCILKTQFKQHGKPTVGCAQYDEKTLLARLGPRV